MNNLLKTVYKDGENEIGGVLTGVFGKYGRVEDVELIQFPNKARDKKNEYLLPASISVMWKMRKHLKPQIVLKEYKELTNLEKMKMPPAVEMLRSDLLAGKTVSVIVFRAVLKTFPNYFKNTKRHIIGEWHSHPGATGKLSKRDEEVLKMKAKKKPYYRIAIVFEHRGEPKMLMHWLKDSQILQENIEKPTKK